MIGRRPLLAGGPALALAGCVSVKLGDEVSLHVRHALHDAARGSPDRRGSPLVDALLIQPQPAQAPADTLSIAYSARPHEFAFYQLASWTERPLRVLPRLLQRRIEARGLAAAVGQIGDPLRADWLLAVGVEALHHEVQDSAGTARLALVADLYDRRARRRVAHRRFESAVGTARADSAAAAQGLSRAVAQVFDALLPWLEAELQRAAPA